MLFFLMVKVGLALHTSLTLAQYILSLDLYSRGKYGYAIKEFNNLIKEHPTDAKYVGNSYYWIGQCHIALKEYTKAEKSFSKVRTLYKESNYYIPSYYHIGRAKYSQKKYQQAKGIFYQFYKKYKKSNLVDNALFWHGVCNYKLKNNKEALKDFKKVLKLYPLGNKADASRYMITLMQGTRTEVIVEKPVQVQDAKLGDLAELLKTKEEALKEKEITINAKEEALKAKEEVINQAQEKLDVK